MSKLRVGVIGTGMIGKHHLSQYSQMSTDVEIVAVADIREDEARAVAATYNVPHVFTDYHKLLALEEIDAVDVCLHNALHCPATLAAFAAGKHVYCEKPLALSSKEALKMNEAAAQAGKKLGMQCGTIFSREVQTTKHLITAGLLGDIYYAKASNYRRRGRPYVDGYGTPPFVQKDKAGGGALMDMAVYHLGLMMYLMDAPEVLTVSGSTFQKLDMDAQRRQAANYDVEELGVALVRLGNGATLAVEEAWAIHGEAGSRHQIYGDRGGVCLNPFTFYTNFAGVDGNVTFDLDGWFYRRGQLTPETAGYSSSQAHWVAGLLGRVPLIDTGKIGLRVCQITEAIYKSAEKGKEVAVKS